MRKIIHIDMDAFFASVEQLDFPELRNKAIAVGGNGPRSVVATASYEARKFGVHSAMPVSIARRRCPHLRVVPPRFDRYRTISNRIRDIFKTYTPLVQPLSIDEAYLDVTENLKGLTSATTIARKIRNEIFDKTGLTASAGISINKFLAKVASDQRKPNGQFLIHPTKALKFMEELEVKKFPYVGEKTAKRLNDLKIYTGRDLRAKDLPWLIRHFGKNGVHFYKVVRCEQNNPVNPHRTRKSVSVENTYEQDINQPEVIEHALQELSSSLFNRLRRHDAFGKTIILKMRDSNFKTITRSKTLGHLVKTEREIRDIALGLFHKNNEGKPIRLLGISATQLSTEHPNRGLQLTLDF